METQVQKWGNSLAIRIPSIYAKQSRIKSGSKVELSEADGKLIIAAIDPTEPTLEMLLSNITSENIHGEVSTGEPVGNESW